MALKIKEQLGGKALLSDTAYNREMLKLDRELLTQSKMNAKNSPKGKLSKGKRSHTYKTGPKAGKTEYVLSRKMDQSVYLTAGIVSGIGVKIQRHGIFLEFGVSNRHPISGPLREKKRWLSGPIKSTEQKAADVAGNYYGDKIVKQIKFLR